MSKYQPAAVIPRGKCILTEKPFVYALQSKYRTERCDHCLTEGELHKCANCRYVYYCNRICQKEAWSIHKTECASLQRIAPRIVPDAARVMARIILKLNKGGDYEKGYYTDKLFRRFKDLMTHYSELKSDSKRMEHVRALTEVLRQLLGNAALPNDAEILQIYGRMLVNAFNILDQDMNSIATGIYLGVSITDHCCRPNAVASFEGTTISIRMIEEMSVLDWSKIFISYVDLVNTPESRQRDLLQNYFFLCECKKCLDLNEKIEMNAAACPNQKCCEILNLQAPSSPTECPKCKTPISPAHVATFNEIMELTKIHVENMKDIAYLDVCKVMLAKQKCVLHKLNVWHVKTLDLAFESAVHFGKWDEALQYGNKLLTGFRKYHGSFNPLVGLLYMKIGKILMHCEQDKEALHNLKKSGEIIAITHGYQHSLYQTQLLPLLSQCQQSCESVN